MSFVHSYHRRDFRLSSIELSNRHWYSANLHVPPLPAEMKLTFRTIKGTTFNLEAEPSTTVGDLKSALEASPDAPMPLPKDMVKLVYKGKVLEDDSKAISEYSVDETGFLVVFVQKKAELKPAAAAPPPAAAEVGEGNTLRHTKCVTHVLHNMQPIARADGSSLLKIVQYFLLYTSD